MQVDYTLVIKMITLLTGLLFFWTLCLILWRLVKAKNGLRTFYGSFLPYISHGCIYVLVTQYWRWTGQSLDHALLVNIWSALLRLHTILSILIFIHIYKPPYHDWYDQIVHKVEILNGATE